LINNRKLLREKSMNRAYLKYFSVFLVGSCLTVIVPVKASIPTPIIISKAATYNSYMKKGYTATAKRDYKTALTNFRNALQLRPNDRYALRAISNVSLYVKVLRGDRFTYVPRNTGSPENRGTGGTRGGGCSIGGTKSLIALLPQGELSTTAKLPVLLFYMPQNSDVRVEFLLQESNRKDSKGEDIYHAFNITPNKTAGIISLDLATFPGIPSLDDGKQYHWYLSLVCDEQDRSGDKSVDGFIKKVALDPILTKELQAAKPSDRAFLYAVNGIWYDAVATLYKARLSNPNDPRLSQNWADLLKAVRPDAETAKSDEMLIQQYKALPSEPLTKCCTVSSSKVGLSSESLPQK
jgi:tetratricopeptide (TPR) repeat protein